MRRAILIVITLLAMISSRLIESRTGCLAKSNELTEPFDHKVYHLVECACDCDTHAAKGGLSPARNQCLECEHFHDPKPLWLVTKIVRTGHSKVYTIPQARQAVQLLINRYHVQNK